MDGTGQTELFWAAATGLKDILILFIDNFEAKKDESDDLNDYINH